MRSAALTELEAKYAIETDGGEQIYITNFGIRSGSADDIASLVRGEVVDASRLYFRCTPRFAAAGGRWEWLGSRILVGTGVRAPDEVRVSIFVVDQAPAPHLCELSAHRPRL